MHYCNSKMSAWVKKAGVRHHSCFVWSVLAFFLLFVVFSLSGCTGLNTNFGCNATAGDSCVPVETVNRRAEAGVFNRTDQVTQSNATDRNDPVRLPKPIAGKVAQYAVGTPFPGAPVRYHETVQRIWIAPFEDQAGTYHEPSYVYTVLKGSHWLGLTPERVKKG